MAPAPSPDQSRCAKDASRLIAMVHDRLVLCLPEAADRYFSLLRAAPSSAEILARLTVDELKSLKDMQTRHLQLILAPALDEECHRSAAAEVGRAHEMMGISLTLLATFYEICSAEIGTCLAGTPLLPTQRELVKGELVHRLFRDLSNQVASHRAVEIEIAALFTSIDKAIQEAGNLPDLLNGVMKALTGLDGLLACLFSRPDARGAMQIEAYGGEMGRAYAEALQSGRAPMFQTSPDEEAGQGPAGRAWRSGLIYVNNSTAHEKALNPWRDVGMQLGFRASVAVPLLDEARQPFGILSLYSQWPGFFSSPIRRIMLEHIQQAIGQAVRLCEQSNVIPVSVRRAYQQLVGDGAVEMFYQPIIDFGTGRLHHVEALARLRDTDGSWISPAAFLPALGNNGLLRLFQVGLEQVCRDFTAWNAEVRGSCQKVAINLPADGLTDDAYRDCVFETLRRWQLPVSMLELEILEGQDPLDIAKRDARISEFRAAGVRIVQDDLGAGHSSLLRLDRVPFDSVKIDQGLVRSALDKPWRALEFIFHLTRLAHDFHTQVTVEGLEDDGLVEAAAILGADCGQGYGIGRPMPARDLLAWDARWSLTVDRDHPRTALGALAGFLLWGRQLRAFTQWPDLIGTFIERRCLVRNYLATAPDPELEALLLRHHEAALLGITQPAYAQTQQGVIIRLSNIWRQQKR